MMGEVCERSESNWGPSKLTVKRKKKRPAGSEVAQEWERPDVAPELMSGVANERMSGRPAGSEVAHERPVCC